MKLWFNKALFRDIRFWIVVFGIIRLYGITNAPLEIAHSWRQVTVNMVARNFVENDANVFYPQVDMAGEKTGITGMEFPLLNYFIYLISKLFGFQHWYGRLINLIISSIGIFYFYKLIERYFTKQLAFNASIFLLSSIWFAYSRKIMPDTFSVSLVMAGLYYASQFLTKGNIFRLLLSFSLLCLGVLSKLPAGFMLVFVPLMMFPFAQQPLKRVLALCLVMLSIGILNALWYFYWVPHLVETYGYWHFYMGTSLRQGFSEIIHNLQPTAEKFYFDAMKFSGFILFIAGIVLSIIHKSKKMLWIFVLGSLAYNLVVIKGGRTFYLHSYYIIPFVPLMALVAAWSLQFIKSVRLIKLLMFLVIAEGILNQMHDFRINTREQHVLRLENIVDLEIPKHDLMVINGDVNPRDLYFTHRKGWTLANDQLHPNTLDSLQKLGCHYLIFDKTNDLPHDAFPYPIRYQDSDYVIFSLE
ncbi:MAG: glycosyltransferase family 39 protein [Bacteroidota bacterium]